MADPIEIQRLLERAWAIALGESPVAGQPLTTTDYRRAISSAYYALFHAITLASASRFAPDEASRHELVRWFRHGDLKAVATWVHGGTPPRGLEGSIGALRGDERVRSVAVAFQRLIEARETADYDHNASLMPHSSEAMCTTWSASPRRPSIWLKTPPSRPAPRDGGSSD